MLTDHDYVQIQKGTSEWERIATEAARTIPGRENGGNCDIKNLSRGSKIYLPVFVEGANLSTGDMHFSQGDGEVSFCGAIEMSGFLELKYVSHFSLSPCHSMIHCSLFLLFMLISIPRKRQIFFGRSANRKIPHLISRPLMHILPK